MLNLSYLTDTSGNQIAVQISIEDWLLFQKEFEEIKHIAKKENRKLQSLTEFLNEC